jgi:hypothetical protein
MLARGFPARHRVQQISHTFRRCLNGSASYPFLMGAAAGRTISEQGKDMSDSGDFTAMSDPDFLAEYSRVRESLEELTDRMRELTSEFDRRAGAKWASAS